MLTTLADVGLQVTETGYVLLDVFALLCGARFEMKPCMWPRRAFTRAGTSSPDDSSTPTKPAGAGTFVVTVVVVELVLATVVKRVEKSVMMLVTVIVDVVEKISVMPERVVVTVVGTVRVVVAVTGFGVTVVTGVEAEITRMISGRGVLATVVVGTGDLTVLVPKFVEHFTPVEVDTPAVIVNVTLKA